MYSSSSNIQFTDTHYGRDIDVDKRSTQVMRTVLNVTTPDFVAFTGDMIAGSIFQFCFHIGGEWNHTEGWFEDQWRHWTLAAREQNVPYAYTLGNHDDEANLSRREIIELDMTNPNSLTSLYYSEMDGASNFVIPVYRDSTSEEVVLNLWFFDSMDYRCYGVDGNGCVSWNVVEWFRKTHSRLVREQGGVKKGLAFMHIPPQEFMYAWDVTVNEKYHLQHYPSKGSKNENICCQAMNTGVFAAVKERFVLTFLLSEVGRSKDFLQVTITAMTLYPIWKVFYLDMEGRLELVDMVHHQSMSQREMMM